jgi:hypothetical protein
MVPNGTDLKQPLKRLWPETRSNRSQVGDTVGRYSISDHDFIVSGRGYERCVLGDCDPQQRQPNIEQCIAQPSAERVIDCVTVPEEVNRVTRLAQES